MLSSQASDFQQTHFYYYKGILPLWQRLHNLAELLSTHFEEHKRMLADEKDFNEFQRISTEFIMQWKNARAPLGAHVARLEAELSTAHTQAAHVPAACVQDGTVDQCVNAMVCLFCCLLKT